MSGAMPLDWGGWPGSPAFPERRLLPHQLSQLGHCGDFRGAEAVAIGRFVFFQNDTRALLRGASASFSPDSLNCSRDSLVLRITFASATLLGLGVGRSEE